MNQRTRYFLFPKNLRAPNRFIPFCSVLFRSQCAWRERLGEGGVWRDAKVTDCDKASGEVDMGTECRPGVQVVQARIATGKTRREQIIALKMCFYALSKYLMFSRNLNNNAKTEADRKTSFASRDCLLPSARPRTDGSPANRLRPWRTLCQDKHL